MHRIPAILESLRADVRPATRVPTSTLTSKTCIHLMGKEMTQKGLRTLCAVVLQKHEVGLLDPGSQVASAHTLETVTAQQARVLRSAQHS